MSKIATLHVDSDNVDFDHVDFTHLNSVLEFLQYRFSI